MKKVLIAFDGTQFSEGAFEFAGMLNEYQPILLTGVFLPQVSYANVWSYATAMDGSVLIPLIEEEEGEIIQKNMERFQNLCIKNGIAFRVHKDYNDFALPEIIRETRFADLLLISGEKFFENMASGHSVDYMRDVIREVECPVIVIPEKFSFPRRNIIAYDGSASSVFALKQFAYVLPELTANETLLVYSNDKEGSELPSENYIEELAAQHYKNLKLLRMEMDPKKYFNDWLKKEERPILISGALGRSALSQMFKKTFIDKVITDHQLPLFIAHR